MDRFKLTAPDQVAPGQADDMGAALRIAADAYLAQVQRRTGGGVPNLDRRLAAAIYELAGDAYIAARVATNGHGQRAFYESAAEHCRALAAATRPA